MMKPASSQYRIQEEQASADFGSSYQDMDKGFVLKIQGFY